MPIHLPAISRRRFLSSSMALGALAALPRGLFAQDKALDPNSFALLSDSHISGNRDEVKSKAHMAKNFAQACGEVLALPQRPAAAFVNGDLAVLAGQAEDYTVFVDLIKPLREGKIPVTLTLGNHDHRANFFEALGKGGEKTEKSPVEDRHVSVVKSPHANWFLLDTLEETNKTPGLVGAAQLKWLAAALDEHKDKPAIIMAHHTHDPGKPVTPFGMKDTDALFAELLPRRQVKAFIHGHSHNWRFTAVQDLHIIGLPPTAYVFNLAKPSGWVHAQLSDNGMALTLHSINPAHPEHKKTTDFGWRSV